MKQALKNLVKAAFKKVGIEIVRSSNLQLLKEYQSDIDIVLKMPSEKLIQLVSLMEKSKSQLKQDLFVLAELDFKKNGFFVEFGATNGITLSNSYLLEKEFGWNGILAEPAKCWHSDLRANRNCNIETDCVWTDSNSTLSFNEVDSAELSTINVYSSSDQHSESRKDGKLYSVNTITLTDLLDKYNAPNEIDYLSIDTEGSEYEILNKFNFNKYQFKVITCEHAWDEVKREKIFNLLTEHGYIRKYIGLSKWDDWYIRPK